MTDWAGLAQYIRSKYKVAEESDGFMALLFATADGRSQAVFVTRSGEFMGTEWADISTVVATRDEVDPEQVLRRNAVLKCGALSLLDDGKVLFFHRFPLRDWEPAEFEIPLSVVVNYGDQLEQELGGRRDRF